MFNRLFLIGLSTRHGVSTRCYSTPKSSSALGSSTKKSDVEVVTASNSSVRRPKRRRFLSDDMSAPKRPFKNDLIAGRPSFTRMSFLFLIPECVSL